MDLRGRAFECAVFFFFNDTATTEIYTLSLHDALPISDVTLAGFIDKLKKVMKRLSFSEQQAQAILDLQLRRVGRHTFERDRKSTRLNSSHLVISYAVFCLKKKKTKGSKTQAQATSTAD